MLRGSTMFSNNIIREAYTIVGLLQPYYYEAAALDHSYAREDAYAFAGLLYLCLRRASIAALDYSYARHIFARLPTPS